CFHSPMLLMLFFFLLFTSTYLYLFVYFNTTSTTEIYTLSLHDALPILLGVLFLNRLMAEMSSHQEETNLILSLGGTPKQAIHRQLTASIKASTIPTIEQQKVTGLVQLH